MGLRWSTAEENENREIERERETERERERERERTLKEKGGSRIEMHLDVIELIEFEILG